MLDVLEAQKRRPAMKKISTVRVKGNMIFKGHQLTIGLDLGDRGSCYCVLDEAGEILLEQKVATTEGLDVRRLFLQSQGRCREHVE
jgi:hypothetical protein